MQPRRYAPTVLAVAAAVVVSGDRFIDAVRTTDRTAAQAATDTADGGEGAGGAAEQVALSHADDVGDEGRKATSS